MFDFVLGCNIVVDMYLDYHVGQFAWFRESHDALIVLLMVCSIEVDLAQNLHTEQVDLSQQLNIDLVYLVQCEHKELVDLGPHIE